MHLYSSVTFHVSPKNPISEEKLKIMSTKIQTLPQKNFLSVFVFDLERAQTSEYCYMEA